MRRPWYPVQVRSIVPGASSRDTQSNASPAEVAVASATCALVTRSVELGCLGYRHLCAWARAWTPNDLDDTATNEAGATNPCEERKRRRGTTWRAHASRRWWRRAARPGPGGTGAGAAVERQPAVPVLRTEPPRHRGSSVGRAGLQRHHAPPSAAVDRVEPLCEGEGCRGRHL